MIVSKRLVRVIMVTVAVAIVLTPGAMAWANIRFFTNVMKNLQHYRVSGDQVNFSLDGAGTGDLTFYLTLPSRRNNVEEVIMAGYLSAGYAIKRTGLKVNKIYITAIIVKDDNHLVPTMSNAGLLAQLVNQQIDPHRFIGEIEWIK